MHNTNKFSFRITPYARQLRGAQFAIVFAVSALALSSCEMNELCKSDEYQVGAGCERCGEGEHINPERSGCEENSDTDCGYEHLDCTLISGEKKHCDTKTGACISYEHCESDADCQSMIRNASLIVCEKAACKLIKCNDGYHLSESKDGCDEDTMNACGADSINCIRNNISDAECIGGQCAIKTCQADYHRKGDDQTQCFPDTELECGDDLIDCRDNDHATQIQCRSARCTFDCEEGFEKKDGRCVKSACTKGQHEYMGECEDDTIDNCGIARLNCQTLDNTNNQSCKDGACEYRCEADTEKLPEIGEGCWKCENNQIEKTGTVQDDSLICAKDNLTVTAKDQSEVQSVVYSKLKYSASTLFVQRGKVSSLFGMNKYYFYNKISFSALVKTKELQIIGCTGYCNGVNEVVTTIIDFGQLRDAQNITINRITTPKLDMQSLTTVGNSFSIDYSIFDELDFPSLRTVGGPFELMNVYGSPINDTQDWIDHTNIDALTEINGDVFLGFLRINNLSFKSLKTIKGNFAIGSKFLKEGVLYDKPLRVKRLDLPELETLGGVVTLHAAESTINMPKITTFKGLELYGGTFDPLTEISEDMNVYSNDFNFPNLKTVGGTIRVENIYDIQDVCYNKSTDAIEDCTSYACSDSDGYKTCCYKDPERFEEKSLKTVGFAELETARNIRLVGDVYVGTIHLPKLSTVSGDFELVSESAHVTSNYLNKCSLTDPYKEKPANTPTFYFNNLVLNKFDVPNLESVGSIKIIGFSKLDSIFLSKLKQADALSFYSLNSLKTVNLPRLTTAGYLHFSDLMDLEILELPSLTNANRLNLDNLRSLNTLDLPNLTTIDALVFNCYSKSCRTSLTVNLPNLKSAQKCEITVFRMNKGVTVNGTKIEYEGKKSVPVQVNGVTCNILFD